MVKGAMWHHCYGAFHDKVSTVLVKDELISGSRKEYILCFLLLSLPAMGQLWWLPFCQYLHSYLAPYISLWKPHVMIE